MHLSVFVHLHVNAPALKAMSLRRSYDRDATGPFLANRLLVQRANQRPAPADTLQMRVATQVPGLSAPPAVSGDDPFYKFTV
jgi:hypothetical protein